MIRSRQARPLWAVLLLAACTAVVMPMPALAQQAAKPPEPPKPRVLVVSPAAAPVPALKYRLLPSFADLNPGDAAPIYLRIQGYENAAFEGAWRQIGEKSAKWMDLPFNEFPIAEARGFVDIWSNKLKQLEFGTRRATCDWNYTLTEERDDVINILLPDAQSMREWGRVLALKVRVEIAEGKLDEAVRTTGTGLAFARHVAKGPFLMNALIGIAIANKVLGPCDELIAQPGAPNLYWALTALPRPLIGIRDQLEIEQKLFENLVPEFSEAELNKPRLPAEWASFLARMHQGIVKWGRNLIDSGDADPAFRASMAWGLDQFKAESLPAAKDFLKNSGGLTDPQRAVMCDDQVIALYLASRYREQRDELFKESYLPLREALPRVAAVGKRLHEARIGPVGLLADVQARQTYLSPPLGLDRRIATLRVIEALRLHAAAHDGALPESLGQITEVPVPDDPATGKPFIYRRAGTAAILHGPQAGLLAPWPTYRISIRR